MQVSLTEAEARFGGSESSFPEDSDGAWRIAVILLRYSSLSSDGRSTKSESSRALFSFTASHRHSLSSSDVATLSFTRSSSTILSLTNSSSCSRFSFTPLSR
eukprot:762931-Hanusia_phi.AAC.6